MMTTNICYCFGYTDDDIRADIRKNGRSTIIDQILAAKKNKSCDCSHKNPKGR